MGSSNTDWAFDMVEHVIDHYAEAIQFTPDERQPYADRVVGTITENGKDARAVILPKGVGSENANRYRRWVTLGVPHWENMTNRPAGWRYFVLMVGLLPDGQPWWTALYDEQVLAQQRDFSEQMRNFYRFDPGLTGAALVMSWDKDGGQKFRDTPGVYHASLGGNVLVTADGAEFVASIWDFAASKDQADPLVGRIDVDGSRMTVHVD